LKFEEIIMTDTEPDTGPDIAALRKIFSGECKFIGAADTDIASLPPALLPEIAVVGRSNVGKSSLLNALTNRTSLARVSHTPGRTRQINFFQLANSFILVDLPGYGYAKASKKMIANWGSLVHDYFRGRPTLARVFVLIDSRLGVKPSDHEMFTYFDHHGVSYQVVLTKTDKITKEEEAAVKASIMPLMSKHAAMYPEILATSSRSKEGIESLQSSIAILMANLAEKKG
jgi:GTP-binding protein